VTGGALVPIKLHWYFLDFIWGKGQWRLAKKAKNDTFKLYVNDCHGVRTLLQRLDTHDRKSVPPEYGLHPLARCGPSPGNAEAGRRMGRPTRDRKAESAGSMVSS
jgi:hypothetical protein